MSETIKQVIAALDEIAPTELVWPDGLLHRGGPHRRLRGVFTPISIGEDECAVFGRIVQALRPKHCFIIGNAFGLSAAYIALTMKEHGGKSVVTLDSQSEGDGRRCAEVAQRLADRLGLSLLRNRKGYSPQDVPKAVEEKVYDLVFIDGRHRHPQVTQDFDAIVPYTDDSTVFVWHDYWLAGIPQCVATARELGYQCVWLPTSCEMVVGARSSEVFERLRNLFPEGSPPPRGRPGILEPLLMLREFIRYQLARLR